MASRRMSPADAAWLHMDRPTNLMVVNALLWTGEAVDAARLREVLRERLVERFPRFRRRVAEPRLGLGLPSWEDDPQFDLDLHLHRIALPAPGDREALQEVAADLMAVPLDRSRPLWDVHLIEGFGEGTAILARMHHCIADGIALARVLLSLTDEQADAGLAPEVAADESHGPLDLLTAPARAGLHVAEAAMREAREVTAHPAARAAGLLGGAAAESRAVAKLLLTGPDRGSPLRGEPGVGRRVAWRERIALDEVKAIADATGTTVNDVVLAAVTGALRRYLADRGAVPESIRAMVPFNLRPLDRPLPRELGNRFGLVYLELPLAVEDRAERLAELHRRMDAIKRSPEGSVAYAVLGLVGALPPIAEQRAIDLFSDKATAVMTNVPGPRRPVYIAGARVKGALAWVPAGGRIGVGLSIFSYDGGISVGLQTAASLVPEPQVIVDALAGELLALGELSPRPRPRRRARTSAPGPRG
jgi:diacylglycerol O-acyltransferase / wax synthase